MFTASFVFTHLLLLIGEVGFLLAAKGAAAEGALQRKKVLMWVGMSHEKLSFILGSGCSSGVSPSPWSTGMMDLAENLEVIYGAQQLRGKILSRKDLGLAERFLLTPLSLCR